MHKGDQFAHQFELTQAVYEGFVGVFNDRNPLHIDEDYARSKGFNGCVMHGNILGGFLSYFVGECLPDKNVMIYTQKIEFKKPVYLNDRLLLNVVVDDIHESVRMAELSFRFLNQQSVCVAKGKIQTGFLS